jgi:hypothetical protein
LTPANKFTEKADRIVPSMTVDEVSQLPGVPPVPYDALRHELAGRYIRSAERP